MHAFVIPLIFLVASARGRKGPKGIGKLVQRADPPVPYEDTQPRLEIRLSPPRHPLPELSGEIQVLEQARRLAGEKQTARLLKAFDEELLRSRGLITELIRAGLSAFDDPAVVPSSFFQLPATRDRPGRVWVSVESAAPVDGAVLKAVEAIERANSAEDAVMFKGAVDDMHEVTRFTLQQLNESMTIIMHPVMVMKGSVSSFIALEAANARCMELKSEGFGKSLDCDAVGGTAGRVEGGNPTHQHVISVFAEESLYPTVESLVQDMLKRREVDEALFRARSLALMARLAQEQSKIAADLLQSAVASITVQYSQVARTINMTKDELTRYNQMHPQPSTRQYGKQTTAIR